MYKFNKIPNFQNIAFLRTLHYVVAGVNRQVNTNLFRASSLRFKLFLCIFYQSMVLTRVLFLVNVSEFTTPGVSVVTNYK